MGTEYLALVKGMALVSRSRVVLLLSAILVLGSSSSIVNARVVKRQDNCTRDTQGRGFFDVTPGGGSWLTNATKDGLGEPINVVLSANSDAHVLTAAGFQEWALSIQYGPQFLNVTGGGFQLANLGDGNGFRNQTGLLRYNYRNPTFGTLNETLFGGSHFRYWLQSGCFAASGAWFIAASVEESLTRKHMIIPNGYDEGRNQLVGNATMANGTASPVSKRVFFATSQLLQFLPPNSSQGINHNITTDGQVAILTVTVANPGGPGGQPNPKPSSASMSAGRLTLRAKAFIASGSLISMSIVALL
ncbi:BQ2448_4953 [Microbotryum intermedium]|uniref:BQ2448_4953 protein n=1 Tax=Microbotryum intermedium TaxID=269621 RepID=A0A238FHI6_9BASI|nr:BQ2448_4953 [Microbotryum intermedium]